MCVGGAGMDGGALCMSEVDAHKVFALSSAASSATAREARA